MELSDAELKACRRGAPDAWARLYDAFGGRIHRVCRHVLADAADADDAAQEVFVLLLDKIHRFDGRSTLSTWIYRVATNHCLNLRKQSRRRRLRALPDESAAPAETGATPLETSCRAELRADVHAALARLAPLLRAAVVLREIEGLGYREIAEVLGVPIGTVMSRLARGRARLVELFASAELRAHVD